MFFKFLLLLFVVIGTYEAEAKTYGRCEFAKTLLKNGISKNDIGTWSCIAKYESNYNTKAINTKTGDYGIFQISHYSWCSDSNKPGKSCGITCKSLLSDNISGDIKCAKKVKQAQGFDAWVAYKKHCKGKNNSGFTKGCF